MPRTLSPRDLIVHADAITETAEDLRTLAYLTSHERLNKIAVELDELAAILHAQAVSTVTDI
jgi:hypothetical protein